MSTSDRTSPGSKRVPCLRQALSFSSMSRVLHSCTIDERSQRRMYKSDTAVCVIFTTYITVCCYPLLYNLTMGGTLAQVSQWSLPWAWHLHHERRESAYTSKNREAAANGQKRQEAATENGQSVRGRLGRRTATRPSKTALQPLPANRNSKRYMSSLHVVKYYPPLEGGDVTAR